MNRRELMKAAVAGSIVVGAGKGAAGAASGPRVVTPNGVSLPWTWDQGVKVFHLVAQPLKREFTPGLVVNCWGYNGHTPGPTLEAVEGDRVRILVTNRLAEVTSIHWHGFRLPFGMDGVAGLSQKAIEPGETYQYEFTLRQHGTLMYHPHADEMTQMAMGMMGFFIIHPRHPEHPVERDFAIMLGEWLIPPDTATPNTMAMADFNYFTFNSRVFPGTASLNVQRGDRVRIRLGNLTMDEHPIHLHGHIFHITGTPGGRIPASAQIPEATVNVPVGTTRDIEFVADALGDWPLHCHKTHHAMNGMAHDVPNLLGVSQKGAKIEKVLPDYMPMGQTGMAEMDTMDMGRPKNTIPMATARGPYGNIEMGGMFTIVKVRDQWSQDPGWYRQPPGTSARKLS